MRKFKQLIVDNVKTISRPHPATLILVALILVYFSLTVFNLHQRYIYLEMKEPTDSAGFIQMSWSVLNAKPFTVTVQEHHVDYRPFNGLGDQLQLTLALFSPLFFFTSQAGVLFIIIQALIISLAVIPLYFFTENMLKNKYLALLISASYFFNAATYDSFAKFGFRVETLFIPAFFAMFYYLEKDRYIGAGLSLLFALLTKHNSIAISFMLGLYFLIFDRKRRRFGIFCLIISIAYYIIGVRMILYKFQTNELASFKHFADFGETPQEIIVNMVSHPGKIIAMITPRKLEYFLRIIFLVGVFALVNPVFWVCLPQLILNAVLKDYNSVFCAWHWALVVPFLFVGAVYTIKRILDGFKRPYVKYILYGLLSISLLYNLRIYNTIVLDADKDYYYKRNNIDTSEIIDRLSIIEPDASVMVSGQLLWFFAAREFVYNAWMSFHGEVNYVAVVLPMWQDGYTNIDRYLLKEIPNSRFMKNFKVVQKSPNLIIMKNITRITGQL